MYGIACTCGLTVDFTDQMNRDVLIAGIADKDNRKEILSKQGIFEKPLNYIIACVEGKETAKNALPQHPVTSAVSSFKKGATAHVRTPSDAKQKANCPICQRVVFIYKKTISGIWNSKCLCAQHSRREVGVAQVSSGVGAIVGKLLSLQSEGVGEVGVPSVGSPIKLTHLIFFFPFLSTRDRTNIRAVQPITANRCCAPA